MANPKYLAILFLLIFLSGCSNNDDESFNIIEQEALEGFMFVGQGNYGAALFHYDIADSSHEKIWEERKEKVIELKYSDDRKSAFMITASNYGTRGAFPFISGVKLRSVDVDSFRTELIYDLGDGLQLNSVWESGSSFKITMNSFNKTNANFIEQRTMIFSAGGNIVLDETRIFDLTNEGYPNLPRKQRTFENMNYKLSKEDDGVYLSRNSDKKLITKTYFEIREAEWTEDRKYLIFSAVDLNPQKNINDTQTSLLIIYSIDENKIAGQWEGSGIKTFFIQKDHLAFDSGFEKSSSIIIFDLNALSAVDTIKINGGCGLQSIPQIKGFGAQ